MAKGKTNWRYAKQAFDNIGKLNVPGSLGVMVRVDKEGIDLSVFHTLLERPSEGEPMSLDESGAQLQTCAVLLTVLRSVMARIEASTPMNMKSIHDAIEGLAFEHSKQIDQEISSPSVPSKAAEIQAKAGGK